MLQHNYENQRNKVMFLYNCKKKAENLNICLFCEYFRPQGCIKHSRNKGLMESEFEGLFYLYSSSVSSHPDLIWGWTCSEYALIALLRATCLVSSGFERFRYCVEAVSILGWGHGARFKLGESFSQIKANFSFWCTQLRILAGKKGKLHAGVVWIEFLLFYRAGVYWIHILSILFER